MKTRSIFFAFIALTACSSVFETRPDQELSDAITALRAAKEVNADTFAPDLYRKAQQALDLGKREYRFKNYMESKTAFVHSRSYSEKAEYSSLKGGAVRHEVVPVDQQLQEAPPPPPQEQAPDPQEGQQPSPQPSLQPAEPQQASPSPTQ